MEPADLLMTPRVRYVTGTVVQWEEPGLGPVVLKSVDRKRPLRKGQSFTF